MVYDFTSSKPNKYYLQGPSGFAIHENVNWEGEHQEHHYALYTDDGRGNGDYVCGSSDLYWIRRIAYGLDAQNPADFNYHGEPITFEK